MPDADDARRGQVVQLRDRTVLRFVRDYPVSRVELWSAITEPDRLARWAFETHIEPSTGGSIRFDYGEAGTSEGTIIDWTEPDSLEYEWATDTDDRWHVRFELTALGPSMTRLTFDHVLPDPHNPAFAAGWHWHLDRLDQHLAGDEPAPVPSDEHFDELLAMYSGDAG